MKPPPNRVHLRPHSFPTPWEKVEPRNRKFLYCNKGHELDACRSFSANEKELRIEAEVSDEENIDNDIMSEFEAEFHTKISGIKLNSLGNLT
ncbi:hypothetical protein TNCV_3630051 [Trichonephila clavipes]|nr:hypothetical protein TNCV_3630051 [Trichonephila clavipes]